MSQVIIENEEPDTKKKAKKVVKNIGAGIGIAFVGFCKLVGSLLEGMDD
jgi:hypothetical protein